MPMVKEQGTYPTLRGVLREKKVRLENLAVWTGLSLPSVYAKINGVRDWQLGEALAVKAGLGTDTPIEILFKR